MKISKKYFILIVLCCIVLVFASVVTIYAWLIYDKTTNKIDANSQGIKYVYSLDDSVKTTSISYNITNLTFFDIDDANEIDFFIDMACIIEFEIQNTGDIDITYEVSQTTGLYDVDSPGVLCLFSTSNANTLDTSTYDTVADLIADTNVVNDSISGNLVKYDTSNNTSDSDTYYLYIIGVQPIDTSINDFLYDDYNFTITINVNSQKLRM